MHATEKKNYVVFFEGYPWNPRYGILMHSTGLRDKNNREIFEGDVLRYSFYDDQTPLVYESEVHWSSVRVAFVLDKDHQYFFDEMIKDPEVIGNIYENQLTTH